MFVKLIQMSDKRHNCILTCGFSDSFIFFLNGHWSSPQPRILLLRGHLTAEGWASYITSQGSHVVGGGGIMSLEAGWCQLIWCRSGWFGFVPVIPPDGFAPTEPVKTTQADVTSQSQSVVWMTGSWPASLQPEEAPMLQRYNGGQVQRWCSEASLTVERLPSKKKKNNNNRKQPEPNIMTIFPPQETGQMMQIFWIKAISGKGEQQMTKTEGNRSSPWRFLSASQL